MPLCVKLLKQAARSRRAFVSIGSCQVDRDPRSRVPLQGSGTGTSTAAGKVTKRCRGAHALARDAPGGVGGASQAIRNTYKPVGEPRPRLSEVSWLAEPTRLTGSAPSSRRIAVPLTDLYPV